MTARNAPAHDNIHEIAAGWLVREDSGRLGADGNAALEAWLAEDASHRAAYAAARQACDAAARHAADPQMMELRAAALAAGPDRSASLWRMAAGIAAGVLVLSSGIATVTAIKAPAASRIGAVAARDACDAAARHAADPQMMELRAAALAAGPDRSASLWRTAAGIVAGVLVLSSGLATVTAIKAPAASRIGAVAARFAPTLPPGSALYRTDVGERSTVVLPDGSVATLNTNSVLKVAYNGSERGVRLLKGQALFEVAHNKRVPFQVYAGDRRITAVGTVFDVRLQGERVKVALVEGVVKVASVTQPRPQVPREQVTMTAGEVLDAPPTAAMSVKTADIRRATSWREGVVVFDDAPLADAVAEINRYTTHPVVLADASIGAYRVSGVFKTGDPERFAEAMSEVFPLSVDDAGGSPELKLRPK